MLTAKDGEIENYDGRREIDLLLFGCSAWTRLAQLNGCSLVGNESTLFNEVELSARKL